MARKNPPEKNTVYYIGSGIALIGVLMFFSVFLSGAMNFGKFDHFENRVQSMALRAVGGIFLIFLGQVIVGVGAAMGKGSIGSALMPDPDEVKEEMEVLSDIAGKLASVSQDREANAPQIIKIRCQYCNSLNNEEDHVCSQCGANL